MNKLRTQTTLKLQFWICKTQFSISKLIIYESWIMTHNLWGRVFSDIHGTIVSWDNEVFSNSLKNNARKTNRAKAETKLFASLLQLEWGILNGHRGITSVLHLLHEISLFDQFLGIFSKQGELRFIYIKLNGPLQKFIILKTLLYTRHVAHLNFGYTPQGFKVIWGHRREI